MSFETLDHAEPRRTADVMLEVLRSEGVRYLFGNPGTTEMPLLNALEGQRDLSYILGLQEACVVAMADGYAKASGRTGFVNLHAAGGLGNAMGAIITAQVARTPLVITAGQQDTRHSHLDPLLGGNLVSLARSAVKWADEVTAAHHLPIKLRRAFQDSRCAPSGPVFLSLPIDVLEQVTTVDAGAPSKIYRAALADGLEELATALMAVSSGRLAIIVGDEVFSSDASAEVVTLAEALGAPVFGCSWPSYIPFPTAHALWSGCLPTHSAECRKRLSEFDAVLALGGHSIIPYLYSQGSAIPPTCRLFQLSADAHNLGRVYPAALACAGDIKRSLGALIPLLTPQPRRMSELVSRSAREIDSPRITPFVASYEVVRAIGSHVPIVDESPVTMQFVRASLCSSSSRQYYFMRSAILGWGMPAAVGVSLGIGREPVVCLVGDGSAMYSPQALWTAAHEQLPVTFIVTNNREYNILKTFVRQREHYTATRTGRFIGMDLTHPPIDFMALAASMGLTGRRVENASEIAAAVEHGIASERPNVIELFVASESA